MLDGFLVIVALIGLVLITASMISDIKRSRAAEIYYREQTTAFRKLLQDAIEADNKELEKQALRKDGAKRECQKTETSQ